jgi:hypothetical protein
MKEFKCNKCAHNEYRQGSREYAENWNKRKEVK